MSGSTPAVGQMAPAWSLMTGEGQTVRLSDFRGKKVILYFYPKDDTPGCTKEACSFQQGHSPLVRENAVVLGVSGDDVKSHQRFAKKFGLTFPLLSDSDHRVCEAYGVYKQKSMYGRTYWGLERTTFIIDPQGRIRQIFPKVKVNGHIEEVLEAVRTARRSTPHAAGSRPALRPR